MSLRVIGVGFGRTGTLSLKLALERLGFAPPEHMTNLFADPARVTLWLKAAWRKKNDTAAFRAGVPRLPPAAPSAAP